jgi:hypothetical protein
MSARPTPGGLRWFFFVIGVGSLIASGIYLGTATRDPDVSNRLLRALMFLLNGLFWILMYGENRERGASGENGLKFPRNRERQSGSG